MDILFCFIGKVVVEVVALIIVDYFFKSKK